MSAEEEQKYTDIIDGILATGDLETISRKKIRQGLEAAVGKDLDEQKVVLDAFLAPTPILAPQTLT